MMKTPKRILAIFLTLLMMLSVLPVSAAFAEEIDPIAPEEIQTEDSWQIIDPTDVDETNEMEPEYIVIQKGDETLHIPVAPDPNASVAIPEDPPAGVDWAQLVERMFQAIYNGEQVSVLDLRIPYTEAVSDYIFQNCYYNPRFLRTGVNYGTTYVDGVRYFSYFTKNAEDAAVYRQKYDACVDALESLMCGVIDNTALTDVDKCLILHDRLCAWCEYDYVSYLAESIPEDSYSPYGALALRLGVCNGIALAYGWMLDLIGIENYYISSSQINHGWNMVYLDGEPYYVDCTWDDPVWDRYGYVQHNNFMQSFATFSAGHRNATDFDQTPSSTIYEDYFCTSKKLKTQVCLIDGNMYYLDQTVNNAKLIKRTPAGVETELMTVPSYSAGYYLVYPFMLNIGHTLLYTQSTEIHAYDVRTGTDTVVFQPDASYFPDDSYSIMGFRQIDGVLEAYVYNDCWFSGSNMTQAEFDELRESHCATFTYCEHNDAYVIERLKGPTCLEKGEARTLCPDCGKVEYVAGEGVLGDHSFTAETVKTDAHAANANCLVPEQYYYSCEYCGAVERDDAHTFGVGDLAGHNYSAEDVKDDALKTGANCQGPAVYYYSCTVCGDVEHNDAHTFPYGGLGDHIYTAEVVKEDALKTGATCHSLGIYYYSCSLCGTVESNAAHTFNGGELLPHAYVGTGREATATCPGHTRYLCPVCGAVAYDGFTFYEGNTACGVIDNAFGWQIVNGVLSVCGVGAIPDFTEQALPPWHDYASSITSLVVNDDITAIGDYNFYELRKMTAMTLPEETVSIGAYAFAYTNALQTFVMPRELLSVGDYAFRSATKVSEIVNNDKITTIGSYAFSYMTSLQNVVVPGTAVNIGYLAYAYLYNVTSIVIEEGTITELPTFFWYGSSGTPTIQYIHIPSNIKTIGSNTIVNSLSHTHAITVAENNPYFTAVDGVLYSKDMTTLVKYPAAKDDVYYHVPDTVTNCRQYAFAHLKFLQYLDLRDTAIGTLQANLLYKCNVNMFINLPAQLTKINNSAFDTYYMSKLYVPASVTTVGDTFSKTNQAESVTYYTNSASAQIKDVCEAKGYTCVVLDNHTHNYSELVYSADGDCENPGMALKQCECGEFIMEPVGGDHDYSAEAVKDEALKTPANCQSPAVYYYSCSVCGAVEHNDAHTFTSGGLGGHDFTARTVSDDALKTPANCQSAAVYYYSCVTCGAVEHNDANTFTSGGLGGHDFTAATVKEDALKTPATCQSPAVYYFSCAKCGAVENNNEHTFPYGENGEHNWEWKIDTYATCTTPGVKHQECTKCHAKQEENTPIEATGEHDYTKRDVKDEAKKDDATCTSLAVYYFSCNDCGAVEGDATHVFTAGDYAAHNYTARTVKDDALKTPATCESPAVYYYSCANCGAVEHNDANIFTDGGLADHNWEWKFDKEPTCGETGLKHQECSKCHNTQNENTVEPATGNHSWEWKTDTPATCRDEGVKHQECKKCHATQNSGTAIPKTDNHSWNDGAVTKNATCTAEGEKTFTCTVCGKTKTEKIGKTAHSDGNGDGYCDNCGADLDAAGRCKLCGEKHTGFFGSIVGFFHRIIYFFKNLFK